MNHQLDQALRDLAVCQEYCYSFWEIAVATFITGAVAIAMTMYVTGRREP